MNKQVMGLMAENKDKAIGLVAMLMQSAYTPEQILGIAARHMIEHELQTEEKDGQFIVYLGEGTFHE